MNFNKLPEETPITTPYGVQEPVKAPLFAAAKSSSVEDEFRAKKLWWSAMLFPCVKSFLKTKRRDACWKNCCIWFFIALFLPFALALDLFILALWYSAALVGILPFSIFFAFGRCCGFFADQPSKRFLIHWTKLTLVLMIIMSVAIWIAMLVLSPGSVIVIIPSFSGGAAAARSQSATAAQAAPVATPSDDKSPIMQV